MTGGFGFVSQIFANLKKFEKAFSKSTNVYLHNKDFSTYMKEKLICLKGEINKSTIIPGVTNIFLSNWKISKQNTRKDINDLNCTIKKCDLIFISRTFCPIAAEYTCFSKAHGKIQQYRPDFVL